MPTPRLKDLHISQPQPATMQLQAMKMGDMMDRTAEMQKRTDISRGYLENANETLEFNKKQKKLEMGKQFIPSLTKEDYPKFREWVKGIDEDWAEFMPGEAPENFDNFKQQVYLGADNLTKMNIAQYNAMVDQVKEAKKAENARKLRKQQDDAAMARAKVSSDKKETKEEKAKQKKLTALSNDYFQQMGRGYSAERGTGQFIPDENKAAVAKKAYDSAQIVAQQYVNEGGKWEDLGLVDPDTTQLVSSHQKYKSAEDVRDDFKAGKISEEDAVKLLRDDFKYE